MWQFFTSGGSKKSKATPSSQAGIIVAYGSATPPTGWLSCNGASVSTTTYATLFGLIGYTYGGSGASFLLPDLSARVPMGSYAGAQDGGTGGGSASPSAITGGTAIAAKTVGTTGGEASVTLTGAESATAAHTHTNTRGNHRHTIVDPGHAHGMPSTTVSYVGGSSTQNFSGFTSSDSFPTSLTQPTLAVDALSLGGNLGGGNCLDVSITPSVTVAQNPHENRQNYVIANYIIKT